MAFLLLSELLLQSFIAAQCFYHILSPQAVNNDYMPSFYSLMVRHMASGFCFCFSQKENAPLNEQTQLLALLSIFP